MKFETYQYADISTRYLTPEDLNLIRYEDCPSLFAATVGANYGSFFYICGMVPDNGIDIPPDPETDVDFLEQVHEWVQFGLSQRFIEIMREVRRQNIPYVRFDADGGDIDGLPVIS